METKTRLDDLRRIDAALRATKELLQAFQRREIETQLKENGDPVTAADRAANDLLFRMLPRDGEGWLSEESRDDLRRVGMSRVWIVDPLDGTKEFLAGIPEWCVSIALIEDGEAVAGGICNPATGETFLGSRETGMVDPPAIPASGSHVRRERPVVLASRSEAQRGEWDWLRDSPFEIRPVGSIAYKLALVAAGRADATWTLTPKNEWDIAGGIALLMVGGGKARRPGAGAVVFNQRRTQWEGLIAFSGNAGDETVQLFENWLAARC